MKKLLAIIFTIALAYITAYYTTDEEQRREKAKVFNKIKFFITGELDTTDLDAVYNQAYKFQYDYGYYNDAIELYDRAIKLDSTYLLAYYNKAQCYLEINDTVSAINSLNNSLQQKPTHSTSLNLLGEIYFEKGALDKAEKYFKASEQNNESAAALHNLAKLYFKKEDYQKALEYIKKALEIEPKNLYLLETNRQIALKMNNTEEAEEFYYQIKEIDPSFYPDYKQLAIDAANEKEYQKAVNYYTLAIQNEPSNEDYINSRGWIYIDLQKYDSAYYDFNLLINLDSTSYYYYFNRAYVLDYLDSINEAIRDYYISLKYKRDYKYSYNNLGYEYDRLKDYKNAIKYYSKSIDIDTTYTLSLQNRGILYYNLKKYDKAITDLKKALAGASNDTGIIYYLALCYDAQNENEKALDYYNEYIRLKTEITDSTRYNYVIERIAKLSSEE
jgi:tetratricopeptide (TPR) repeat protein